MRVLPDRYSRQPQYVFHPRRALRRARRRRDAEDRRVVVELPWGLPLEVHTSDAIGFSILAGGVFDPCVTETLHRLIDPGDVVADVGANIGYLTSLAAVRAGALGKVLSFEPHPEVFGLLEVNAGRWRGRDGLAEIELHRLALADREGSGELIAGPSFEANMGLASLSSDGADGAAGEAIAVPLARLDDVVADTRIGVMKVDVEGHEAGVFRGAERLLAQGAVRDIVFEDLETYPSDATAIVEAAGYDLISLDNDLLGLRTQAPSDRGTPPAWPGPNYLATREPARARERLGARGWQVPGIVPSFMRRR
jgi:FkbM family methyltransferase